MRLPIPLPAKLAALVSLFALLALFVLTIGVGPAAAQPAKPAGLSTAAAELEARVAKLEASGETNTLAIAELSSRLAEITQRIAALGAASGTNPELVNRVDDGGLKIAALERELETLRTQLADLEQPYAAAGGGSVSGFTLESGDYSATLSAYLQARWELLVPKDFATITESGFRIRRGRVGLKGNGGKIFAMPLRYKFLADFTDAPSLRDYYVDLEVWPELIIRAGQDKLPFIRSFLVSSSKLLFPERSNANSAYRYDRDIGLWAHGTFLGGRLGYHAGVSNGAGPNARNDNIDFAVSARVHGAALGELIDDSEGDVARTAKPALTFGLSAVHDLVRLPDIVGGVLVNERDVDSDEVTDNVRVLSMSADATFRLDGLELGAEGYFRRESWGTILDHSANEDLANLIRATSDGNKSYVGAVGQASYFVLPEKFVVGGRLGYSQQTFLGLGGRSRARPPANRLFEFDLISQLYMNGQRLLGLQYTLTNYNSSFSVDPPFDIEHRFIVETQLIF